MASAVLKHVDIISAFIICGLVAGAQTEGDVGYQYSHEMYEDMLNNEVVGIDPTFDVPVANMTVTAGQIVLLPCLVHNLGDHKVAWTADSKEGILTLTYEDSRIVDDSRFSIKRDYLKDWTLEIRDVKHSDEGIYRCTVNTKPITSKIIKLFVKVPARIIDKLSSDDITAREGDTVVLICNTTGVPPPTVTWYRRYANSIYPNEAESKNCITESSGPVIGSEGEMVMIQNISRYCDDIYECSAYNGEQDAVSRIIRVTVEYTPEVILTVDRLGQVIGRETVLECTIYGYPLETTHWMKNGIIVNDRYSTRHKQHIYQEGQSKVVLSLTINNIQQEDFGDYVCFAKNHIGTARQTMELYRVYPQNKEVSTSWTSDEQPGNKHSKHTYQTEGTGGTQVIKKHPLDEEAVPPEAGSWGNHAASANVCSTTSLLFSLPLFTVIIGTLHSHLYL